MRRKDLEVTDGGQLDEMIRQCPCLHLGLASGKGAYVVPLNFGYRREAGKPVFYFHSAGQGRKVDLIRQNAFAGFTLDGAHRVNPNEKACDFSLGYVCVMGEGPIRELTTPEEKAEGLSVIMGQVSGREDWALPAAAVEKTLVFCLEAHELTGRRHG